MSIHCVVVEIHKLAGDDDDERHWRWHVGVAKQLDMCGKLFPVGGRGRWQISATQELWISLSTCQNWFLRRTLTKVEESGDVYASLGTRQEGGSFEDIGLSIYASPLWILVLGFRGTEFQWSAVGPKVSGGVRETEETEELVGSIQCDIRTEELPPQHAQYLYYTVET